MISTGWRCMFTPPIGPMPLYVSPPSVRVERVRRWQRSWMRRAQFHDRFHVPIRSRKEERLQRLIAGIDPRTAKTTVSSGRAFVCNDLFAPTGFVQARTQLCSNDYGGIWRMGETAMVDYCRLRPRAPFCHQGFAQRLPRGCEAAEIDACAWVGRAPVFAHDQPASASRHRRFRTRATPSRPRCVNSTSRSINAYSTSLGLPGVSRCGFPLPACASPRPPGQPVPD